MVFKSATIKWLERVKEKDLKTIMDVFTFESKYLAFCYLPCIQKIARNLLVGKAF